VAGEAAVARLPPLAISEGLSREVAASLHARRGAHPDSFVEQWVERQRGGRALRVRIVPLDGLRGWRRKEGSGDLGHETGRFFTILGLQVRHRAGRREISWDQPVIEQPETGILGILAARIRGVLHFCLQAKEEPGNIGGVQLSPTVQATFSNYTRAHGGAEPPFLSFFAFPDPASVLFSRLQTEDGSRFLYKSNRNMIVLAGKDPPVELPDAFIWLTLNQIAALLRRGNLVNACARSVLSALAFPDAPPPSTARSRPAAQDAPVPPIASTLQWLDDWRAHHHLAARRIGLNELQEWRLDGKGYFSHIEERFFRVVGLDIEAESREVSHWGQPIIENASRGIIGLLVRERAGAREFLMQARAEPGNRPAVQIAPTVQFTPGNYHGSRKLRKPFLFEEFGSLPRFPVLGDSLQAEEGARFFRECHAHRILLLPEGEELDVPPDFRWVPEEHLRFLLHLGEQVNSCARSVISCLL
jgi:dTDP-4-dehydro-6-deoxy-alpha-D-glucopyranose 2,3-dehydratase